MIRPTTETARQFSLRGHLRSALYALFLLLLSMSLAQRAAAQGVKFTSPVSYPGISPFVVAAGDFNQDGKMDLVCADNNLVMLLGNGDGTFKPAVTYHLAAAPYEILPADFNRDGKLDLAIRDSSPATGISILFGKGDGSFEQPLTYAVAGSRWVVADLNRDGWPDLVGRTGILPDNSNAVVLLNDGKGGFQKPTSYSLPRNSSLLRVKDVNGDGKPDLVAVSKGGAYNADGTISVLFGNGDGTFRLPINSTSQWGSSDPLSIVIEDFDRDGKVDIAVTDAFITVVKGNGDGTFGAPVFQTRLANTSADLKVADFNGDGRLDLVSAGVFRGEALQILLGNGDGTFQDAGWNLIPGSSSVSVVVADFNGDTKPDIAAEIDNQLTVALRNVTPGNVSNTDYFVHQHYLDFLDREPDAVGFNFWSNQISSCGSDQTCIDSRRNNVSSAFYLSIEFQQTSYLVERIYKAAYGDANGASTIGGTHPLSVPIVRLNEFLPDTQQIGQDVVVGQAGWDIVLENNKQSFVAQFVQRPRFMTAFPTTLTPAEFVDRLNQNAGNVLSSSERATAISLFVRATDTSNVTARAQTLRQIVENQNLYNAEFNRAFVLMEYFGYLRRNPDEGQDRDYSGYDFWLTKLNQFNGDYQESEMVKAFINSSEYRKRFGP